MADAKIDLTKLSQDELLAIRNDVLRALAERARTGGGLDALYDRHGSGHSKNSDTALQSRGTGT